MSKVVRQQPEKPLFPKLLWSRPENRQAAGKLLIIGGTQQSFATPSTVFRIATKKGIGTSRIILPDSIPKPVQAGLPGVVFTPANQSGAFALASLTELLQEAQWADGVILCDDIGRNSETLTMLESFFIKYVGILNVPVKVLTELPPSTTKNLLARKHTLIQGEFADWQKLFKHTEQPTALTSDMGVLPLAENLHTFLDTYGAYGICMYEGEIVIHANNHTSITARTSSYIEAATGAVVWWVQNPSKPFESITTSLVD